ncbi:MAG: penicillin-binding protein 2 [Gammaproteobacteria bacterium]|nr:penicillin-binding protein 2 [Gammaproteobacteria bacterium]MBP9729537.1 penicillin-binding protein 2 [Gammaproteobacteria bacterium]
MNKYRYRFICIALMLGVSGLIARVVQLQVLDNAFLCAQGDLRTMRVVATPAYRGMIVDRQGEPLAISTPVDSVWMHPKVFDKNSKRLAALSNILGIPQKIILNKVTMNAHKSFVYLKRHITPAMADQIKLLQVPGVYLKQEYRRYYPAAEVSAHLVGLTDLDGRGKEGLELALEKALEGTEGSQKIVRNRRGHEIKVLGDLKISRSGQDVQLSIDQRLQYLAYRELKATVAANRALGGSAVVLDVQTGEVLAMVNQPSFNPNTRVHLVKDGRYRNRAVTDLFEPGSPMKTFSILSALEHGQITETTLIDTSPGQFMIGKHTVREDKHKDFGVIDAAGILRTSSNVGVGKIVLSGSPHHLWQTYDKVGFGRLTDSGFPGERAGILRKPPEKPSFVLATMAFGYGMSVTPLQLAQAYAILGNQGVKRPISFLKQAETPVGEQVIDPVAARQVLQMLAGVVEQGSGLKAQVIGYRTAGKTGTTRKIAAGGGYDNNSHVAVFAGLAPARHPRFAIVVMIDDPKTATYYGSQIAAPLFSKIAGGALRLFGVPPEASDSDNLRVAQIDEKNSLCE